MKFLVTPFSPVSCCFFSLCSYFADETSRSTPCEASTITHLYLYFL